MRERLYQASIVAQGKEHLQAHLLLETQRHVGKPFSALEKALKEGRLGFSPYYEITQERADQFTLAGHTVIAVDAKGDIAHIEPAAREDDGALRKQLAREANLPGPPDDEDESAAA